MKKGLSTLLVSGLKTEEEMTYDLAVEGWRVLQSSSISFCSRIPKASAALLSLQIVGSELSHDCTDVSDLLCVEGNILAEVLYSVDLSKVQKGNECWAAVLGSCILCKYYKSRRNLHIGSISGFCNAYKYLSGQQQCSTTCICRPNPFIGGVVYYFFRFLLLAEAERRHADRYCLTGAERRHRSTSLFEDEKRYKNQLLLFKYLIVQKTVAHC